MSIAVFPDPVGPVMTVSLPIGKSTLRLDKLKTGTSISTAVESLLAGEPDPGTELAVVSLLNTDDLPEFHCKVAFSNAIFLESDEREYELRLSEDTQSGTIEVSTTRKEHFVNTTYPRLLEETPRYASPTHGLAA